MTDNDSAGQTSSGSDTSAVLGDAVSQTLGEKTSVTAGSRYSSGVLSILFAGAVLSVGAIVYLRRTSSDSVDKHSA